MDQQKKCPLNTAIGIIKGKWKSWIIWSLKDGPKRHGELKKMIPKISGRIISKELRELEEKKIIVRKVLSTTPVGVEYSLTSLGHELNQLFTHIERWGCNYSDINDIPYDKFTVESYLSFEK